MMLGRPQRAVLGGRAQIAFVVGTSSSNTGTSVDHDDRRVPAPLPACQLDDEGQISRTRPPTADDFGAFVGLGACGLDGSGVAAVWRSRRIDSEIVYSGAAKGRVILTLTLSYLWDFGLPRASKTSQRVKFVT